jgi:copper resistance protein C
LFVADENAPSQLFLNKGDGTFVDIEKSAGVGRIAYSEAPASVTSTGTNWSPACLERKHYEKLVLVLLLQRSPVPAQRIVPGNRYVAEAGAENCENPATNRRDIMSAIRNPVLGRLAFLAAAALLMLPVLPVHAHVSLVRSAPEANATLSAPPPEIRLWFSEAPQTRGTSVRLVDAAGELVATTPAIADEADPRQVFIRPEAELAPGSYTVHWRAIAQDGHASNGRLEFRVQVE